MISKGNILDKFDDIEISFLILTERREVLNLRNNTNIKKIAKVDFFEIDKFLKLKQNTKYQILTLSQKKIFEVVHYQNYDYLMLIYPDSIFLKITLLIV